MSTYDYYCILDFEATCISDGIIHPQEIIEFPTIILNNQFEQIATFHHYVKPIYHPRLTPFCMELTGIQQTWIDEADTFKSVWKLFQQFLLLHCHQTNNIIFITAGNWDLLTMLPNQCQLSNVAIPSYMKKWINIRTLYHTIPLANIPHLPHKKPRSMKALMDAMGIDVIGRLHSGIDDTKNITRLFQKMIEVGANLEKVEYCQ